MAVGRTTIPSSIPSSRGSRGVETRGEVTGITAVVHETETVAAKVAAAVMIENAAVVTVAAKRLGARVLEAVAMIVDAHGIEIEEVEIRQVTSAKVATGESEINLGWVQKRGLSLSTLIRRAASDRSSASVTSVKMRVGHVMLQREHLAVQQGS